MTPYMCVCDAYPSQLSLLIDRLFMILYVHTHLPSQLSCVAIFIADIKRIHCIDLVNLVSITLEA